MKFMFGPDLGTVFTILLALGLRINLVLAYYHVLERNRRSASSYMGVTLLYYFVLPLIGFILIYFWQNCFKKEKWRKIMVRN